MGKDSKIRPTERAVQHTLLVLEQIFGAKLFRWTGLRALKSFLLRRIEARLSGTAPTGEIRAEIDRREQLTPEQFRQDYFLRSRPVVMAGAAKNWPCVRKWNLDYFRRDHGQQDLLIVDAPGLTTREQASDYEFLSVQSLIDNIRQGGEKYLRFSPLMHERPTLAADLDLEWLAQMRGGGTFGNTYYMFIGGPKRKTLLHSDQPCNLYVQVFGEKRWTFFMPEDTVCLYPECAHTAYVNSPVDLDKPDYDRFPLLRHARAFEVVLKPGDVLYVPPHVWHQVENLTETIAVGYRFSSAKAALRSSVAFSLMRVFSMDPPVWKTREYGKVDTNLIWAHAAGKIEEVLRLRERRRREAKIQESGPS